VTDSRTDAQTELESKTAISSLHKRQVTLFNRFQTRDDEESVMSDTELVSAEHQFSVLHDTFMEVGFQFY